MNQTKESSINVSDPASREAAHILMDRAWPTYGALHSSQKGIVHDDYPSYFLVEAGLRHGVNLLALDDLFHGLSTATSFTCPSSSRTLTLL